MKKIKSIITWFRKTSWKKRGLVLGVIFILALIFTQSAFQGGETEGIETEEITRRTITETVNETGNVITAGKTEVHSPTNGVVEEVYVSNGDIVGANQDLFRVVSTATDEEKAESYASYLNAQNSLKQAEQSKKTLQSQLEQARKSVLDARQAADNMQENLNENRSNPTTGEDYTQLEIDSTNSSLTSARQKFNAVEKQYVEADVSINAAKASLTSAGLSYQATQDKIVRSPTIGTISNLSVSQGDSVQVNQQTAGLATNGTPPVLSIANFSTNQVTISLGESDISKIKVGQKASIEPDALQDITYEGLVKRVDNIGEDNEGVVTYTVYIDILNAGSSLKSGMTVNAEIETETVENVLTVPSSAVRLYRGERAVQVINEEGKIEYIPVKIGVRDRQYTEILSGIEEGQEVVTVNPTDEEESGSPFSF